MSRKISCKKAAACQSQTVNRHLFKCFKLTKQVKMTSNLEILCGLIPNQTPVELLYQKYNRREVGVICSQHRNIHLHWTQSVIDRLPCWHEQRDLISCCTCFLHSSSARWEELAVLLRRWRCSSCHLQLFIQQLTVAAPSWSITPGNI